MLNPEQGNNLIKSWIGNNRIFSVSRIGGGESAVSYEMDKHKKISDVYLNSLKNNAGFYGEEIDYFVEEYIKGISCADLQVVWDMQGLLKFQDYLFEKYSKNSIKIHHECVVPFFFDSPWSESLENKKVLVIHPFRKTIIDQYSKRKKLFKANVLPDFELKVVAPPQSIAGNKPHSSWKESLEITKEKINEEDFDIALLGCGSYGLPLVNHIKTNMNKTAIYIGGALQLLFGIKGRRWDDNVSKVNELYNDYWVRPSKEETPANYNLVEGGTYW